MNRGGGGGVIAGCIFLFPVRWAYNRGGLISGGGGGGGLITGILRYAKGCIYQGSLEICVTYFTKKPAEKKKIGRQL